MTGESLEIFVTNPKTRLTDAQFGKATLAITDKAVVGDVNFSAYSTAKARLVRIRVADDKLALSALRGTLSINAENESRHLFALTGIERALSALAVCLDQLRAVHNVNKADLAAIVTKPKSYSKDFFFTDDYPGEGIREEKSGTVEVLVWVEVDGRISACEIVESSASPVLDQATCDLRPV